MVAIKKIVVILQIESEAALARTEAALISNIIYNKLENGTKRLN